MAITTDSYYDVIYNEETVDRIGLSKTLNNYTTADISAMTYCGTQYLMAKNLSHWEHVTLLGWDLPKPFDVEDGEHIGNGGKYVLSPGISEYQYPDGLPLSVIWLSFTYGSAPPAYITTQNSAILNSTKIITEWDAPKYELVMTAPVQKGGKGATAWSDADNDLYAMELYDHDGHDNSLRYRINNNVTVSALPTGGPVCPYGFFEADGNFMLFQLSPQNQQWYTRGNGTGSPWIPDAVYSGGGPWINFAHNMDYGCSCNVATLAKNSFDGEAIAFPYTWYYSETYSGNDWGVPLRCFGYNDLGEPIELYFIGPPADGNGSQRGLTLQTFCKNRDQIYKVIAGCGIKFVTDKVYKPIIKDGWVTGYTDDMSAESELDGWHGTTQHTVAPSPPSPPVPPTGDEDNTDPVSTTGAPFSSGLCHYYALTAGSVLLEHISDALGTWDIENTHKDLYKNLVSCKLIKPPAAIPTTGSAPFTIYGVKPQYEGADITLPVVSGNPDASFGPYTIDRKFGDFRDYAPYTRVSIFLPYCGWCDLPSHVVGRQVSVKYFTDIIAATCRAVVFCNNNIIAEAAGVIGLDIPFVADNVGAKMQAVTAGMIAALGGGIQLGAGIGTMVSTKSGSGAKAALSGASQYLSGYSQMAMAFNENTTEISGKNGDGCCLAGATNIIIKIVRPKKGAYTTAPFTPPGYGHNVGFVSQKQVKVSSVSGLLIADNVDTSGISGATEAERAEIKRVLETGLIVNAAPE